MVLSQKKLAGANKVRSAVSMGLHTAARKVMSILPDFDSMVQILALLLVMKMADGFTLDKDTIVGTGMLAMLVFEELL